MKLAYQIVPAGARYDVFTSWEDGSYCPSFSQQGFSEPLDAAAYIATEVVPKSVRLYDGAFSLDRYTRQQMERYYRRLRTIENFLDKEYGE